MLYFRSIYLETVRRRVFTFHNATKTSFTEFLFSYLMILLSIKRERRLIQIYLDTQVVKIPTSFQKKRLAFIFLSYNPTVT